MEITNFNIHQFKKLKQYKINNVENIESKLYILSTSNKWEKQKELFKVFNLTEGEYFNNKLYTISSLINRKSEIDIKELVLPNKLGSIQGEIKGYVMPFIEENINLETILTNNYSLSFKLKCLTEVGLILEKVSRIPNFYLNDIHEANFIYDIKEKYVKAVDLDSVKINNNLPNKTKFMFCNENLLDYIHKYPYDDNDVHYPNLNTMYLSYIYMILNTISKTKSYRLNISEYYDYLQFLIDNGFGKELVDIFSYIYLNKDNKTPLYYLEQIPESVENVSYEEFKKLVKKY